MRLRLLFLLLFFFSSYACSKIDTTEVETDHYLRFATWNIAHFNLGPGIENRIDSEDKFNYFQTIYKSIFQQVGADFLSICEFESPFYVDHQEFATYDALLSDYEYYKDDATSSGAYWIAFFSHLPISSIQEVEFLSHPEGKYRYYLIGTMRLGEKDVKIVCTHLTHATPNIYAPEQMKQLVRDLYDEPYVVILADWNSNPHDLRLLEEAGYVLANNDTNKRLTYYSMEYYDGAMDNIAVKGGDIKSSSVMNTNAFAGCILSDHYLLFCDVTF